MAKQRIEPARLNNGMTPRQMRWVLFLSLALSAGAVYNMLNQSKPAGPTGNAPSAEGLSVTNQGTGVIDKFDPAARNICDKTIDTALMCADLQTKYPALSKDVITAAIQFSKYYGHKNPSALLALALVEAKGNIIDGFSSQSTAFGPFHYLVDTFADRLLIDKEMVGKKIARENLAFIENVKVHFPNNPEVLDAVVQLTNAYTKALRADLAEIAKLNATIKPAGKSKEQIKEAATKLEEATAPFRARVHSQRLKTRDTLLKDFPQVVMAIQFVDILTKVSPERLFNGSYYAEHVLGVGGSNYHQTLLAKEQRAKIAQAEALAQKKPFAPPQKAITAAEANRMLAAINIRNGTRHRKMIIPVGTADIYPAFQRAFAARAPGNIGVFFKIQRVATVMPSTEKGVPPKTVYHTTLTPRTAAEMQAEILRRWEEHHVNARAINVFKDLAVLPPTHRAPTAPVFVRTARNGAAPAAAVAN